MPTPPFKPPSALIQPPTNFFIGLNKYLKGDFTSSTIAFNHQPTFLGLNKYQRGDFTSSTVALYQKWIFYLLNPFHKYVILIYSYGYGIFSGSFLGNLEWTFSIKLWCQKKIIFLQIHTTILQRVK